MAPGGKGRSWESEHFDHEHVDNYKVFPTYSLFLSVATSNVATLNGTDIDIQELPGRPGLYPKNHCIPVFES